MKVVNDGSSDAVKGTIRVTTASAPPPNPTVGDVWINSDATAIQLNDIVTSLAGKVTGTMKIVASATQPTGLANGDIWIDIS